MSSAPGDTATGMPAARHQAAASVAIGAALVIAGGFAFMAVESYQQIDRLIWRPAELTRMASAVASLATTFPLRFVFLVLGSVAVMLAAEYRPRAPRPRVDGRLGLAGSCRVPAPTSSARSTPAPAGRSRCSSAQASSSRA